MILVLCTKYAVDRFQDRMSYGYRVLRTQYKYQGSFFAPSCCQSMVSCRIIRVFGSCCRPCHFSDHCFYLLVAVGDACAFFLPALSLLPGATPHQEARCFSVEKTLISSPISAIKSSLDFVSKPGTAFKSSNTFW